MSIMPFVYEASMLSKLRSVSKKSTLSIAPFNKSYYILNNGNPESEYLTDSKLNIFWSPYKTEKVMKLKI